MLVAGIDPGKKGAIAMYCTITRNLCALEDMPESFEKLAQDFQWQGVDIAILEDVSAMTYVDASGKKRGQGAAASFTFGENKGVIRGVLAAFNVKTILVKPSVWKTLYGLGSDKSDSLELARKKFPYCSYLFQLKKHDGRAEAALLALFGAERFAK